MKITIKVFDVGELEVHAERAPDGTPVVEKAFYAFLQRPGRPHLSFFLEPRPRRSYLEPHFTAFRNSPRQFREPLAQVEEGSFQQGLAEAGTAMLAQYFRNLRPVDLYTLEAEGWKAHYVEGRALRRWIRQGPPWTVNVATATSFARHVLRRFVAPPELGNLDPTAFAQFPALRVDTNGTLHACFLIRLPITLPVSMLLRGDDLPTSLPAGWYRVDASGDAMGPKEVLDALPADAMKAIGDRVRELLQRYPARGTSVDFDAVAEVFPRALSAVFGFYYENLFNWMCEVREGRSASPDGARVPSGPS